jgi:hypothetical protein
MLDGRSSAYPSHAAVRPADVRGLGRKRRTSPSPRCASHSRSEPRSNAPSADLGEVPLVQLTSGTPSQPSTAMR